MRLGTDADVSRRGNLYSVLMDNLSWLKESDAD